MKKGILFIVASIMFINFAVATQGDNSLVPPVANMSINGVISDIDTEELLAGVIVSIEGTDFETRTDLNGNFSFDGLYEGEYTLNVEYISYKEMKVEDLTINADTKVFELSLKSE